MVQRGSDPVSGPSNEFYSNFPFTAHQSRIVPQACCVNPLAQHPVVNRATRKQGGEHKVLRAQVRFVQVERVCPLCRV